MPEIYNHIKVHNARLLRSVHNVTEQDIEHESYFIRPQSTDKALDSYRPAQVAHKRLQEITLKDSRCGSELVYSEIYDIHMNFFGADDIGEQNAYSTTCSYRSPYTFAMYVEQITYYACILKHGSMYAGHITSNIYGIKRHAIKLLYEDLALYSAHESLLYALSGNAAHILNIIGNMHGLTQQTNMTVHSEIAQYIMALQSFNATRLSTTSRSPIVARAVNEKVRDINTQNWSRMIMYTAYTYQQYCGHAEVYSSSDTIANDITLSSEQTIGASYSCLLSMRGYPQHAVQAVVVGDFQTLSPQIGYDYPKAVSASIIFAPTAAALLATISYVSYYMKKHLRNIFTMARVGASDYTA